MDRLRGVGVRVAVAAGVVGVGYLVKPSVVRSTLSSPAALLRVAAIVVGWLVLTRLLARYVRRAAVRNAVVAVPAVGLLVLVVLPFFRSTTINERVPAGVVPAAAEESPAPATGSATSRRPPAPTPSGRVTGIRHDAKGTARLLRLADGNHVVRFEDFEVEPGPDYLVYLLPGAGGQRPGGGTELGRLKATRGAQNYVVPRGARLGLPATVLVWCRAFSVPIAAATLR